MTLTTAARPAATPVVVGRSDSLRRGTPSVQSGCVKACGQAVQTRRRRCAQPGDRAGETAVTDRRIAATWGYAVHRMCAKKTSARLGVHTSREVIHIRNVTADVRSRGGQARRTRRDRGHTALGSEHVFEPDPRLALIGTAIDELAEDAAGEGWTRCIAGWRNCGRWWPPWTPNWPSGCRLPGMTARAQDSGPAGRTAGPGRGQLPRTSTSSVAVTSGCSRTVTWCVPTVRIGVRDLDPAPVEFRAARLPHRVGDVRRAHRAEQPPLRAGPHVQPDGERGQPLGRLLGVVQAADVPGRAGPLDQVDLLLGAAGPRAWPARAGRGSCGRSRRRPRPRRRARPGR